MTFLATPNPGDPNWGPPLNASLNALQQRIDALNAKLPLATPGDAGKIISVSNTGAYQLATPSAASSAPVQSTQTGTTYTFALSDANTTVRFTNAGAVTGTIPPSSSVAWVAGTIINVRTLGAAGGTVAAGAGVTIQNNTSALVQYQEVSLAYDATDSWIRVG